MRMVLAGVAAGLLAGCGSVPTRNPGPRPELKRLSVAIVEPDARADTAPLLDDVQGIFIRHFGKVSRHRGLPAAQASRADLIATLSLERRMATNIFSTARVDVHVNLASSDGLAVESLHASGSQQGRPMLLPQGLNDKARDFASQDLEGRLLGSKALLDRAADGAPAPAAAARLPGSADVDRPRYALAERAGDFALVIGVEKYASLPAAEHAQHDAEAVREHLAALGYPRRNIVFLADGAALGSAIAKYVESWLPRNVGEGSRVFVYFSGHGAPDARTGQAYLVPWDGDLQFLENTGYPIQRLYERLDRLKAKEVLVALDACFSGAGGRSVLPKGARPLATRVEAAPKEAGKLVVLAASGADEIAGAAAGQAHGLFTYFLLKGLNERKGRATVRELHEYLAPQVQEAARRENRDQTPRLLLPAMGDRGRVRLGD